MRVDTVVKTDVAAKCMKIGDYVGRAVGAGYDCQFDG